MELFDGINSLFQRLDGIIDLKYKFNIKMEVRNNVRTRF